MEKMGHSLDHGHIAGNITCTFPSGPLQDFTGFQFSNFVINLLPIGGTEDVGDVLKNLNVYPTVAKRSYKSNAILSGFLQSQIREFFAFFPHFIKSAGGNGHAFYSCLAA